MQNSRDRHSLNRSKSDRDRKPRKSRSRSKSPRDRRRDDYSRDGRDNRDNRRSDRDNNRRNDRGNRKSKFDLGSPGHNEDKGPSQFSSHPGLGGFAGGGQNRFSLNADSMNVGAGPIIPSTYDLPSRKVYVGGIGPYHTDTEVSSYLGATLQRAGACVEAGNPIIRTQINRDKRYLFVELRTAEEAACLMQLDGIDYSGFPLRIRRCQEYNQSTAPPMKREVPVLDTVELGIVSTQVQETPNKVFIGGIPRDWDEKKIKQLLVQHAGKLKSFHLVRDNKDQSSKGYAFCEFATLDCVQMAMQTINGMQVLDQTPGMLGGTKTLNVRRTGIYANQSIDGSMLTNIPAAPGPQGGQPNNAHHQNTLDTQNQKVFEDNLAEFIGTLNMLDHLGPKLEHIMQNEQRIEQITKEISQNNEQVKGYLKENYKYEFCTASVSITIKAFDNKELRDNYIGDNEQNYQNLLQDMKYELEKFGSIDTIKIPRVGSEKEEDVGKVIVTFVNVGAAFACYNLLNSKQYMGQPVDILFINLV